MEEESSETLPNGRVPLFFFFAFCQSSLLCLVHFGNKKIKTARRKIFCIFSGKGNFRHLCCKNAPHMGIFFTKHL